MLTGADLLAKVNELGDASKSGMQVIPGVFSRESADWRRSAVGIQPPAMER